MFISMRLSQAVSVPMNETVGTINTRLNERLSENVSIHPNERLSEVASVYPNERLSMIFGVHLNRRDCQRL